MSGDFTSRRGFLGAAALAGTGLLVAGLGGVTTGRAQERDTVGSAGTAPAKGGQEAEPEVTPAEDLMREHGVLRRILLVYDEAGRRLDADRSMPVDAVLAAAQIVHSFVEEYHEKLEEDELFPRFRAAGKQVDLVDVLLLQHQAGRRLTDVIIANASADALKDPARRKQLRDSLAAFVRMYAPHAAREDTVLFPAIRTVCSGVEYDALGDRFEQKENELFGENGFAKMVERVAGIERALGLYDLAEFTPKA
jgi:hemerythrin-like domain-containing protein